MAAPSSGAPARQARWLEAATPGLLLLTPFVIFIRHHAYDLTRPEILGIVALLAAVGAILSVVAASGRVASALVVSALLVFFVDLQFAFDLPIPGLGKSAALIALLGALAVLLYVLGTRVVPVVGLMALVSVVTTLAMPAPELMGEQVTASPSPASTAPLLVHLILDEHIGIAGLKAAGASRPEREVGDFYTDNGFAVFDRAYSEYADTIYAIGRTLDLAETQWADEVVLPAPDPFAGRLVRSRYFDRLVAQGYAIHAYQPDHLEFCGSSPGVKSCTTYASTKLGVLQGTALSSLDKASVVLGAYLMRSDWWNEAREAFNAARESVPALAAAVPAWDWERTRVSPLATAAMLQHLEARLRKARAGEAYVAHLLLPHFPYTYAADCRTRPPASWLDRNITGRLDIVNTPEGRTLRYQRYGEQLSCTRRWIQRLLDAVPAALRDEAVVIVHGDHGSRIALERARETPRHSDDIDNYSTLFAVRSPRLSSGHDGRQASLACLLDEITRDGIGVMPRPGACEIAPTVAVRRDGEHFTRPLPEFPN